MTRKLIRQLCDVESIAVGGMETVAKKSAAAEPAEETARAKVVAAELKEQANQDSGMLWNAAIDFERS